MVDKFINAVFNNIVKAVAKRALNQISDGSTLNIAGLFVNSGEARRGDNILISKDNYGKCEFPGDSLVVLSKSGEELFRVSETANNVDVLPYVLNSLFVTNMDGQKDVEIPEVPKPLFQVYGFWIIFGASLLLILICGLCYHISDGDGLLSILGALGWVLKGAIPALLISQLIWWIIVRANAWDMSFWFWVY
jgi:hypothetical protein